MRPARFILLLSSLVTALSGGFAFEKQPDGVLFPLGRQKDTDPRIMKVQVCTADIIRIIASPDTTFSPRPSLIAEKTWWEPVHWTVKDHDGVVDISTTKVTVRVDPGSGAVAFYDSTGKLLLRERSGGGKLITPADVMGEKTYHIQQLFDSPPEEAFYGLGGFAVEARYEHPTHADLDEWRELNTRWFQFGVFCPLLRVHGQFPYREMFHVAPKGHPAYDAMLKYDRLRYRLVPYLYSLAGMVTQNDYTIMRALVMDFGNDGKVLGIGDQFMLGPALLVCPVTDYKARGRPVYLPAAGWYDLHTGVRFAGGRTIRAVAPYSDIPVFVREGSIIPCGPEIQYTGEKPAGLDFASTPDAVVRYDGTPVTVMLDR